MLPAPSARTDSAETRAAIACFCSVKFSCNAPNFLRSPPPRSPVISPSRPLSTLCGHSPGISAPPNPLKSRCRRYGAKLMNYEAPRRARISAVSPSARKANRSYRGVHAEGSVACWSYRCRSRSPPCCRHSAEAILGQELERASREKLRDNGRRWRRCGGHSPEAPNTNVGSRCAGARHAMGSRCRVCAAFFTPRLQSCSAVPLSSV